MKTKLISLLSVLALLAVVPPADAGSDDKAEARRVQQAQRRLEQEKARLQQEKTGLESRLKSANDELSAAREAADRQRGQLATTAKRLKTLEDEKLRLEADWAEARRQLAEQTQGRQSAEAEGKRLGVALAGQRKATAECEDKNAQLYRYGQEMALRFERKGFWETLGQAEPLTGLKQVEIENILQEYAEKLDSQRIGRAALSPADGR